MSTLTQTEKQTRDPQQTFAVPRVAIHETPEGYRLRLEMPGVNKEGLEITVENHELTILGHRHDANLPGGPVYRESRPVDYRRVFELDPSLDTNRITARIENGIATLTLPKQESVKPRRIAVTD